MTWKLLVDRPTDEKKSKKAIATAIARGAQVATIDGIKCVFHGGRWIPISHPGNGMVQVDGIQMDAQDFIRAYGK